MRIISLTLPALLAVAVPALASGQGNTRSQLGTVSQTVSGTRIDVTYRRPVARGRPLFGALVPWGQVWTPSADTAARITLSAAVEVNGAKLAAGTYSVWTIPDSLSWTIIFNAVPDAFHLRHTESRDVLRVHATPTQGDHVETLMFAFPMVDADSARLEMHWGTTVVPIAIRATGR